MNPSSPVPQRIPPIDDSVEHYERESESALRMNVCGGNIGPQSGGGRPSLRSLNEDTPRV